MSLAKTYANLHIYTARGKQYVYYRAPGRPRIRLRAEVGTLAFDQEYEDAKAACGMPLEVGKSSIKPRSVSALRAEYYKWSEFRSLKPHTQKLYKYHIDTFCEAYGDDRVTAIKRKHFRGIKDELWDKPGRCRSMLKRLNTLFQFAVDELEWITINPMAGVKLPPQGAGFLPWSDEDIAIYDAHWGPGTRERLGLYLPLFTGQRAQDIVKMSDQCVREVMFEGELVREILVVQQAKTGKELWIPLHPLLAAEIDLHPRGQAAFLIDRRTGLPLVKQGYGNWLRDSARSIKREAKYPDEPAEDRQLIPGTRGPHGLRKAACRRLIEAGCDTELARSISGHAEDGELKVYIEDVNQRKMAHRAMRKLDQEKL